jgi:hypothetical protein
MANIKKLIAAKLGKRKDLGITAATLTLKTPGSRTPGALPAGTNPASTTYACKAFVDTTGKFMDGTLVGEGRSKLSILGGSLSGSVKPVVGATCVHKSITYKILRVVSDPVDALHECEVAH